MLDAAEDGQSHELSSSRRRLPQFRIRIRNPVDRLRWARAVVVAHELRHDAADMVGRQEDEVVEGFFSKGANESLDVGRGVWRAVRDGNTLAPHDLVQPAVQVAAVAAPAVVLFHDHWSPVLPEDPVVVMHEEARRPVLGRGLAELLLHPRERRVARDIDVDDAPPSPWHGCGRRYARSGPHEGTRFA